MYQNGDDRNNHTDDARNDGPGLQILVPYTFKMLRIKNDDLNQNLKILNVESTFKHSLNQ